jgi:very-short-patch-repair endonuclease
VRGGKKTNTDLARRLRRNSTDAERKLWRRLRSRFAGHKFVRQHPIGRYVADFVCREKRLIVEVDGGQHGESASDEARDQWLRAHNYQALRFWNNDVMSNLDGVLDKIAEALGGEAPPHPASTCGGSRPLPASGER